MTIELLGAGLIGLLISTIVAYFAGNKAATRKAEERARTARLEQAVLDSRAAEVAAQSRADTHELRRRVDDAINALPAETTPDGERSATDRLRDEWQRD